MSHWLNLACLCAAASFAVIGSSQTASDLTLPALFTDNMVLQRDINAPIWGTATPDAVIKVTVDGKTVTTKAGKDGKWIARLPKMRAGGPYEVKVEGTKEIVFKNVLFGDVWICSGQSNMEMGIGIAKDPEKEIANAKYPNIRLFTVPHNIQFAPTLDLKSSWQVCSPETISFGGWGGFSATGYYFGRELHTQLGVPIGLIHTSWGGTIAEAWTSAEGLAPLKDFDAGIAQVKAQADATAKFAKDHAQAMVRWYAANDPGSKAGADWETPGFDDSAWKTMVLPCAWEKDYLPDFDGVVWFRRTVELTSAQATGTATLSLGPIDDFDTTYVNGLKVGGKEKWDEERVYELPKDTLHEGKNVIAVRVLDTSGAGGIYGKPEQLALKLGDGSLVSLTGDWKYKDSAVLSKCEAVPVSLTDNPNIPTVLYNGMINPLLPYGVKGAIWYQGESNAGRAYQYRALLPTMIKDWRKRFGVGDFPFYIVGLAGFNQPQETPAEDGWAELREAQYLTTKVLRNCGLATAIDIGDIVDIHPKNKQEVGRRLALNALARTYGQRIPYSGPVYKSMKVEGGKVRIQMDFVYDGLVAKGGKLLGFSIAGSDKKFVWADAEIVGKEIVVSSPTVAAPVAVRYAWASYTNANLFNSAGLPAVPFRTDQWPGVTVNAK